MEWTIIDCFHFSLEGGEINGEESSGDGFSVSASARRKIGNQRGKARKKA
jgi:hypothetical protein